MKRGGQILFFHVKVRGKGGMNGDAVGILSRKEAGEKENTDQGGERQRQRHPSNWPRTERKKHSQCRGGEEGRGGDEWRRERGGEERRRERGGEEAEKNTQHFNQSCMKFIRERSLEKSIFNHL